MAEETPKGLTPPYPAFQTLKTLIRPFKEHGIPGRVDRSVLTSFSGQVGSQVMAMLRFLHLTDGDAKPTEHLRALTTAFDTDQWSHELAVILERGYAPLFTIDLSTATPQQFASHFRATYPGSDDVSRKAMTFFLNASREAGIKVSPYILKGKKPRTTPTKKRVKAATVTAKGASEAKGVNAIFTPPPPVAEKLPSEALLALFDATMGIEQQNAIWTLIKFFKAKGK